MLKTLLSDEVEEYEEGFCDERDDENTDKGEDDDEENDDNQEQFCIGLIVLSKYGRFCYPARIVDIDEFPVEF